MAKIGQYQLQVQQAPISGVKQAAANDPNAFGAGVAQAYGGLGQGLGQAGELFAKRALEMQKEQNIAKTNELASQYQSEVNKLLWGDGGAMTVTGSQVYGLYQNTSNKLSELRKQYVKKVENQHQQELFNQFSINYNDATLREVSIHEARERRAFLQKSTEGFVDSTVQTMALTNDQKVFDSNRRVIHDKLAEVYGGYGADYVKKLAGEAVSKAHVARANRIGNDNPAAALDYVKRNINEIDANQANALIGHYGNMAKNTQLNMEARELLARNGGNLEAALDNVRKGGKLDESRLAFSAGDNPDWQGVTGKAKAGTVQLWNELSGMGIVAEITSGKRSGDGKSHHDSGNGVDIYLGDANGNRIGADDPRVKQVIEKAKANGWQEVLYHDSGTGLHLHLGDYQGTYTGRRSDEDMLQLERAVRSEYAAAEQLKASNHRNEIIKIKNALVNTETISGQIDIVNRSTLLEPFEKKHFIDSIINNRESDQSAVLGLIEKKVAGTLTRADVSSVAGRLSKSDIPKWWEVAATIQQGKQDKASQSASKAVMLAIEEAEGDKTQQDKMKYYVFSRLEDEGVTGWKMDSRGREIMAEYQKNNNLVFKQYSETRTKWSWLYNSWDPREVDGVFEGQRAMGVKLDPAAAENLMMSINRKEPIQQAAIDYLIDNKKPITLDNINTVIDSISKRQGVNPNYVQFKQFTSQPNDYDSRYNPHNMDGD